MKQNWKIKKLGEVCEIYQPKTISSKELIENGKYLVYGANGVIGRYNKYNHEASEVLLTCRGATCGSINVSEPYSWINGNAMVIHPIDNTIISKDYLKYILQSLDYSHIITGAAQPQITRQTLAPVILPLPPLADQRRIVAILDAKFAKIDALRAAAQKNLDNAEQLWKAKLEKEVGNKEWKMMKLGEVAKIISGYAFKSKDFMQNGKYQVIRMGNIKQNQMRLNESPVYVNDVSKLVLDKSLLKINDLVITQTGTKGKRDYGFVARIYKDNLLLNQRCACVRFQNDNTYLPLFFLYFSYTNIYKNQFFANEGGTVGQGNVGLDALRLMNIPIPPLAEQTAIVSRLDALSAQISELKAKYRRQIECCDELRQSLLRAAFEGEM